MARLALLQGPTAHRVVRAIGNSRVSGDASDTASLSSNLLAQVDASLLRPRLQTCTAGDQGPELAL
jgi:hypothetical protein